MLNRKPIATYCKQEVAGWDIFPALSDAIFPGEEEFSNVFIRQSDGLQLLATVKDYDALKIIHVSLAPIRTCRPDWTDEEHNGHIFDVASEVVESFFPGRKFARQPDDSRRPQVKHYFTVLEDQD